MLVAPVALLLQFVRDFLAVGDPSSSFLHPSSLGILKSILTLVTGGENAIIPVDDLL